MSRHLGTVFLIICTLITGGARSAVADHGGRDRAGAREALIVYATAYVHSATHLTPTYARQTGLACSACHTHFPELTATGRAFKLNGYVFRRTESLEGKNPEGQQSLLLNLVAPVSLMFQTSYTSTKKAQLGRGSNTGRGHAHRRYTRAASGWADGVHDVERSSLRGVRGLPLGTPRYPAPTRLDGHGGDQWRRTVLAGRVPERVGPKLPVRRYLWDRGERLSGRRLRANQSVHRSGGGPRVHALVRVEQLHARRHLDPREADMDRGGRGEPHEHTAHVPNGRHVPHRHAVRVHPRAVRHDRHERPAALRRRAGGRESYRQPEE